MRHTFLAVDQGTSSTGSVSVRPTAAVQIASLAGESSPAATLVAMEETILALLLQKGIPSKSTMASLGPVRKTIGDGVCTLLVMAAVGMEAVGIHTESIENKTQQKDRLY